MQQSPQVLNGTPTANITTEQIQKVPIILSVYLCGCECIEYVHVLYIGCLSYAM
jgi:hypothetical protein